MKKCVLYLFESTMYMYLQYEEDENYCFYDHYRK